jgi:hypothetical protein
MRENGFSWSWENVPSAERFTLPAKGRYPAASFDAFFVRGPRMISCKSIAIPEVSDHFPVILTIAIE